jgi:predicted negative regulator of RcsB-dependent stress response
VKTLIIVAVCCAAVWYGLKWVNDHKPNPADNAATHYTKALQDDAKRADDAAAKANAVIQQSQRDVNAAANADH